jgi:hypothetical protein
MRKFKLCLGLFSVCLLLSSAVLAQDKLGDVKLESAGSIAFAPDGVLLVGDAMAATVYAIDTGDQTGDPSAVNYDVKDLQEKVAAVLGTKADAVSINDLAVNPKTGIAFLAVSRGRGPQAAAVLLKVDPSGKISELELQNVKYSKAILPNAPGADEKDRRGESQRLQSITDLAFVNGQVVVAGLSNEEFASNLRAIPYPFEETPNGIAVEVFHGAHGQLETRSPVRTFAPIMVNNEPYVVAAYTCTPLVRFPLSDLKKDEKIRGVTVAELGNRNRPLDMVVYSKGDKQFILMANSDRGLMKINTENIERAEGIEEKINGVAGQTYETIEGFDNVIQLDRLNDEQALIVQQTDKGLELKAISLP